MTLEASSRSPEERAVPPRRTPGARYRRGGLKILRLGCAWLIGLAGPVLSVRGWGPLVVYAPVAARGQVVMAGCTFFWVALSEQLTRRRWAWLSGLATAAVVCAALTGPNVGRALGLLSVASVTAAIATFGPWRPTPAWPARRRSVASLAVPVLLAAQIALIRADRTVSVVLLAATIAVVECYHRRPKHLEATEDRLLGLVTGMAGRSVELLTPLARRLRRLPAWVRSAWPRTRAVRRTLACGGLVALVWSPVIWRLTNGPSDFFVLGINDYPIHVGVAREFSLIPLHVEVPHLLFHLATWIWTPLVGTRAAPFAALLVAVTLSFLGAVRLFEMPTVYGRRLGRGAATWVGFLYFMSETPTLVLHALSWRSGSAPYLTVHWWGNPTWLMGLPFLFATVVLLDRHERELAAPSTQSRATRVWLLATVILGCLAKPTLTLLLIPALPIYLLFVRRLGRRELMSFGAWAIAPAIVIILWQTWFLGSKQSSAFQSGWTFAPIVQPAFTWGRADLFFWTPLVILALAIVLTRGGFLREPPVLLVLVCSGFALTLMLTVRETGSKATDGNMAVPMQACVTLLVILAIRSIAAATSDAWATRGDSRVAVTKVAIVTALALLFLSAGVLSLLDGSGLIDIPTDWQVIT